MERHRDRLHLRRPRHLQQVQGAGRSTAPCRSPARRSAPSRREQLDDGWRLACLAQATARPRGRRAAADHPAQGRDRRRRPPGDPAARRAEAVRRARPSRPSPDQRTDLDRLLDAIDDLEPTADLHALRRLPTVLREADFKVTAVVVDEALIDVEPGDTTAAPLRDRLRPRHHHGGRHPARPRHRHPGRGRLDAQQAAAVRRRRDHPDQRHDDGPATRSAGCSDAAGETLAELAAQVCARGRGRPARTSTRSRSPATRR